MKKLVKKMVITVLTAMTVMSAGTYAFASEMPSNIVIIDCQEKDIPDMQIYRAGDAEYKREVVETKTFIKKYIGVVGNQPSGGTVFTSQGGFFWSDEENPV